MPLVGFYGKSGSGKTLSALKFARGLVGPKGRIVLVDSESKRGSIFCDIIENGYQVIDLEPPFSPDRYCAAFEAAEAHSEIVVMDSLTHEWAGEGGVIDMQEAELTRMAGEDYKRRESCKMAAWIRPKAAHKKFIQRLLRAKGGVICCLRGEEKTHMEKGQDGKNQVHTDEFSTPIFDSRFIFEMLINFETLKVDGQGGYVIPVKITHPTIAPLLPRADQQISEAHGKALADWCARPNRAAGKPIDTPEQKEIKDLKRELWRLTAKIHHEDKAALSQYLWDENFMSDTESLDSLEPSRLREIITNLTTHLSQE